MKGSLPLGLVKAPDWSRPLKAKVRILGLVKAPAVFSSGEEDLGLLEALLGSSLGPFSFQRFPSFLFKAFEGIIYYPFLRPF